MNLYCNLLMLELRLKLKLSKMINEFNLRLFFLNHINQYKTQKLQRKLIKKNVLYIKL